jgi:hypothetical protein
MIELMLTFRSISINCDYERLLSNSILHFNCVFLLLIRLRLENKNNIKIVEM